MEKSIHTHSLKEPLRQVAADTLMTFLFRALLWGLHRCGIPTIVCLCGSTRFYQAFQFANLQETLAGRIVLSIGCDTKSDKDLFGTPHEQRAGIKVALDWLHKRKIDIADEILVLNVDGYVGNSTRSEVEYARRRGKHIRWLEEVA